MVKLDTSGAGIILLVFGPLHDTKRQVIRDPKDLIDQAAALIADFLIDLWNDGLSTGTIFPTLILGLPGFEQAIDLALQHPLPYEFPLAALSVLKTPALPKNLHSPDSLQELVQASQVPDRIQQWLTGRAWECVMIRPLVNIGAHIDRASRVSLAHSRKSDRPLTFEAITSDQLEGLLVGLKNNKPFVMPTQWWKKQGYLPQTRGEKKDLTATGTFYVSTMRVRQLVSSAKKGIAIFKRSGSESLFFEGSALQKALQEWAGEQLHTLLTASIEEQLDAFEVSCSALSEILHSGFIAGVPEERAKRG